MHQKAFATFFGIVILAFFFSLYAATAATTSAVVSETITTPTQMLEEENNVATTTAETTIEYELPYPGLLPDHPLYKIKLARDRILDFLIRDPVKRIEFNLLMADKRLNMSIYLVDRGKFTLAEETASKGEKYFVSAIDEYKKSKDEGRVISGDLVQRLQKSAAKHQMIIQQLKEKSPEEFQTGFGTSFTLAGENLERVQSISQ